jgi:thiamine-monophosphate kinase
MTSVSEIEIIDALKLKTFDHHYQNIIQGIGDDGAITSIDPDYHLVTTTDAISEGVHYPKGIEAKAIGHRCLAVNLSDMAAMGAKPLWASLVFSKPSIDQLWLEQFISGFSELANKNNVTLIGGDTISGPELFSVTLQGIVPKNKSIRRSTAKIGDLVYVTGFLGNASQGLKIIQEDRQNSSSEQLIQDFLYPNPRLKESRAISQFATSMIDISDGFYSDFLKVIKASNVGAEIKISDLPISESLLNNMPREDAVNAALLGGDDYELCFTIPREFKKDFLEEYQSTDRICITCVGEIKEKNLLLLDDNNKEFKLSGRAFEHF